MLKMWNHSWLPDKYKFHCLANSHLPKSKCWHIRWLLIWYFGHWQGFGNDFHQRWWYWHFQRFLDLQDNHWPENFPIFKIFKFWRENSNWYLFEPLDVRRFMRSDRTWKSSGLTNLQRWIPWRDSGHHHRGPRGRRRVHRGQETQAAHLQRIIPSHWTKCISCPTNEINHSLCN